MNAEIQLETLTPLAESAIAWRGFDADWYSASHPEAGNDAASALRHYIETGRKQGLSPNMYFDEAWYCARNPDIAAAIAAGDIASGYQHYCVVGYLTRSPHWLFDDEVYRQYAPDLTDGVLVANGCANRYDHYLKAGAREGRIAHLLFQPAIYAEAVTGARDGMLPGGGNAFQHYLRHVWQGGQEITTSVYFDPVWYRDHYPAAAEAIATRRALCALHHFLTAPAAERGEPLPAFSSEFYAEHEPAAPAAVAAGIFGSLYEHFLKVGVFLLRPPSPDVDLLAYLSASATARSDFDAGRVRDLFEHFLAHAKKVQAQGDEPVGQASAVEAVAFPAHPAHSPTGEMFGSHLLIEIDNTILCPPDGLILYGWMLAQSGSIAALALVSGNRRNRLDPDRFVAVPRADVMAIHGEPHGYEDPNCGFLAYVPAALEAGERPVLEITRASGEIALRTIPEPRLHGFAAIRSLLDRFELRYGALARGFDDVVGPAVESLAAAYRAQPVSHEVIDFGSVPCIAEVSVIIPLYGRIDLMEYQMALFTAHPAGIAHELIYVLDDPPRRNETLELAESLFARFAEPFRLVILSRNVGYAPANNIGLSLARGSNVCLMNSDVFPRDAGWLARLDDRLRTTPALGAVGPLLLFEDDSAQHQGIFFERLPEFSGWLFPSHIGKGRRPATGGGLRRFRAITGACMMIARDTLRRLGGLDESYIIGDFEDVDLCMRIEEHDMSCGVDMDVAMYHLERQSQAGSSQRWRMNLTLANAWLFQRRWAAALAKDVTS